MSIKDTFWDSIKVYFTLVGVALTAFLSIGAIYLAWWINDSYGIILLVLLLLLLLFGGGSVIEDNAE